MTLGISFLEGLHFFIDNNMLCTQYVLNKFWLNDSVTKYSKNSKGFYLLLILSYFLKNAVPYYLGKIMIQFF